MIVIRVIQAFSLCQGMNVKNLLCLGITLNSIVETVPNIELAALKNKIENVIISQEGKSL